MMNQPSRFRLPRVLLVWALLLFLVAGARLLLVPDGRPSTNDERPPAAAEGRTVEPAPAPAVLAAGETAAPVAGPTAASPVARPAASAAASAEAPPPPALGPASMDRHLREREAEAAREVQAAFPPRPLPTGQPSEAPSAPPRATAPHR